MATALAALACCLSSCIALRYVDGNRIPRDQVALIQPGATTKAEVLRMFGAPQGFSDANVVRRLLAEMDIDVGDPLDLPFSDALVFQYVEGKIDATTLVFYTSVEVRTAADTLVVFFDTDDRVTYYGFREGTRAVDPADPNDAVDAADAVR